MAAQLGRPNQLQVQVPYRLMERRTYLLTFVAAANLLYKLRAEPLPYVHQGSAGEVDSVDPTVVEWISLDPSTPTAQVNVDPGWVLRGGATPALPAIGPAQEYGPAVLPVSTAETVEASTGGFIASDIVHFNLVMNGKVAADTGLLVYIAIKGATTGNYYAATFGSPATGTFMLSTIEALQIVVRNASAANAYTVYGYFEGRTGDS